MTRYAPEAVGDVVPAHYLAVASARRSRRVAAGASSNCIVHTDVLNRLDSLPFGRFHLLVIAALGSAYLTVSEIFPVEMRAPAIAFFYALGAAMGGMVGPLLLGVLISIESRASVAVGYLIGSLLMVAAAAVETLWGVAAERKPLETVARPLLFTDS